MATDGWEKLLQDISDSRSPHSATPAATCMNDACCLQNKAKIAHHRLLLALTAIRAAAANGPSIK